MFAIVICLVLLMCTLTICCGDCQACTVVCVTCVCAVRVRG